MVVLLVLLELLLTEAVKLEQARLKTRFSASNSLAWLFVRAPSPLIMSRAVL
jgi:hypothetical protein